MENGYSKMSSVDSNTKMWLMKADIPTFLLAKNEERQVESFLLFRAEGLKEKELDHLQEFLGDSDEFHPGFLGDKQLLARVHHPASVDPREISLGKFLNVPPHQLRIESWLVADSAGVLESLKLDAENLWREPAIEFVWTGSVKDWWKERAKLPEVKRPADPSMDPVDCPGSIGLDFSDDEVKVINETSTQMGRKLTRTEWELLAQTWSEHCKHKIFGATIETSGATKSSRLASTPGIFKTYLRKPALKIADEQTQTYLSLFHDNSGVLGLTRPDGSQSPWAACIKMETHNSPSAISPYGGASTGLVGVHRDILGTGLGAKPIASWDVLCFESSKHNERRPTNALPSEIIRKGVIKGIEDGGNQSGIPTVQGSVVFHPNYSAKPLVYAGAIGSLKREHVHKNAEVGDVLYCVGGAVGADGLRGAVMSSRDLRSEDMQGSAVQVAQAFVQRCLTEFLLEARDKNIISCVTDNGAGGLASSCGETATLTGGARLDLSDLRFKFKGLYSWEKLLSESQERMTVATRDVEAFEALAKAWDVGIDRIGNLNDSGQFEVWDQDRKIVDLSLEFLHDKCPTLKLKTAWTWEDELKSLKNENEFGRNFVGQDVGQDMEKETEKNLADFSDSKKLYSSFEKLLASENLCSREGIVRRYDHEVQGRTRKLPFAGATQESPQDGSSIEVYEDSEASAYVALGHGLAPYRRDIHDNALHSVDESVRQALLGGMKWKEAALLDNYSWPDPLPSTDPAKPRPQSDRLTWKLLRSCEILETVTRLWDMPFVSGKDSMKNTSEGVDVPETLVVSAFGPSYSPQHIPHSFFTRANDVVFYLEPLCSDLRASSLERLMEKPLSSQRSLFEGTDFESQDAELESTVGKLAKRYERFESLISRGLIRAAKDIGEGGLATAVFEMCLGRKLGVQWELMRPDVKTLFAEGLGGFVFTCDVHQIAEIEKEFADLKRVGVVSKPFAMRFSDGEEWPLAQLRDAYVGHSRAGFWS